VAVPADLLVDEAPLASPELALVDAELAVELRRTLSPVEDTWLRPPVSVEVPAAREEDASSQLDSSHDAKAEPRDAERMEDPGLPSPNLEDEAVEGSTLHGPARVEEAPAASEGAAPASDEWSVADERPEAARGDDEQLVVDDYIVRTPEQLPAEEERTRSRYPVLPAPEPDAEASDATDAAFRRIRERLTEPDETPSRQRRIRRGFTLASGTVAACAVAALGADVQLQVAQLPSWLQF
jgi:hypothetical protein